MKYYPTMGLEIHAELSTNTKIFCTCSAEFGGEPNTRCCPVCSGLPGTLPVLNRRAVEYIIRAGYALGCDINRFTKWDRKNYFYPDLPKAYQISQMPRPVCYDGRVEINVSGRTKAVRINRIHLEEDAGKLNHEGGASLADYNRCGIPLVEIVTEPDLHSTDEVLAFFEKTRLLLLYAGICDCKMEQGSIRCDVNISIAPEGSEKLGTRTELKNLNSTKAIVRAIEAEIKRQSEILDSGREVVQETRRFDAETGVTLAMRSKENAHDYRYFPDPDIPPIVFTEQELSEIRGSLPEMPDKRMERYISVFGISESEAAIIVSDKRISDLFDAAASCGKSPRNIASYLLGEFMRRVNLGEIDLNDLKFGGRDFAQLVELLYSDKLSQNSAKTVLGNMAEHGGSPKEIAEKLDLWIKEDIDQLAAVVDELIESNPKAAEQYRSGDQKVLGFFIGQANRAMKGAASPKAIQDYIRRRLQE